MNKGTWGSLLSWTGMIGMGIVVELPLEQKFIGTDSIILLDKKDEYPKGFN